MRNEGDVGSRRAHARTWHSASGGNRGNSKLDRICHPQYGQDGYRQAWRKLSVRPLSLRSLRIREERAFDTRGVVARFRDSRLQAFAQFRGNPKILIPPRQIHQLVRIAE